MKMRRNVSLGLGFATAVACFLVIPSSAQAQEASVFGTQNQFVLSGERLSSSLSYKATLEEKTYDGRKAEYSVEGTAATLGWGVAEGNSPYFRAQLGAIPRLGFDFFVSDSLSIGGSLGAFVNSSENKSGSFSQDNPDQSAVMFNPRVGYQIPFSDMWGIWIRGGFAYYSAKSESEDGSKEELRIQQLTVDGMFNVTLVDGFGLMFGPVVDVGIGGKTKSTTSDGGRTMSEENDASLTEYGVTFGLFGYL